MSRSVSFLLDAADMESYTQFNTTLDNYMQSYQIIITYISTLETGYKSAKYLRMPQQTLRKLLQSNITAFKKLSFEMSHVT